MLLCPWDFPGRDTGGTCHFFLQGLFLTWGLNLHLLHWQGDSFPLSHLGSQSISTPISQVIPTLLSLLVTIHVFTSISICLYFCFLLINKILYTIFFFRFHLYSLIHNICLSLSDFTLTVSGSIHSSTDDPVPSFSSVSQLRLIWLSVTGVISTRSPYLAPFLLNMPLRSYFFIVDFLKTKGHFNLLSA